MRTDLFGSHVERVLSAKYTDIAQTIDYDFNKVNEFEKF